MAQFTNRFSVALNCGRSFGGFEEQTSAADLRTWHCIARHFSRCELLVPGESLPTVIEIDWAPVLLYFERRRDIYILPLQERGEAIVRAVHASDRHVVCNASVRFDTDSERPFYWHGSAVLQHVLYQIFLLGNIATPGSVNLFQSHIRALGAPTDDAPGSFTDLELSDFYFEDAWHEAKGETWAKVDMLDLDKVLSWYDSLGIGFRQVATTKIEKLLFSFLHIARDDGLGSTIWLAGMLENLFDTHLGASFQQVSARIGSLLDLNEKERAVVKSKLRTFFDLRHSYAHGGMAVFHIIGNEHWDRDVDDRHDKIILPNCFAATLLISIVQLAVRRHLLDFRFETSLVETKVSERR